TGKKISPEQGAPISYLVSFRRSFVGYFLKFSPDTRNNEIYFYDLNAKINYNIDEKNRVFVSTYFGRDFLQVGSNFSFDWGNTTGTLRWNHIFNDKLFSNTTFIASNFDYTLGVTNVFKWTSYIREMTLKQDFDYFLNPRSTIKFGFSSAYRQFSPGQFASLNERAPTLNYQKYNAWDNGIYVSHKYDFTKRLSVEYGVRLSIFSNIGAGTFNNYANLSKTADPVRLDTVKYSEGQFIRTAVNPEPRASVRFLTGASSSIKASYNRMVQNVHQINVGIVPLPTSFWFPTTYFIKPQIADQWALGYFRNFKDNMFEVSLEVYYKNMQNAIDFVDNTQAFFNPDLPVFIKQGKGWAYGAELFIVKTKGKLTGQIGYTYSRTFRNVPDVNYGNDYASGFDRPHSLNVLLTYEVTPRLSFSAVFTY
ncbi:MAG: TonB-dependent receptor, partial [Cytophagales bacterium]|nr:TonB-dependent receptor [Cytophagales bacterium]